MSHEKPFLPEQTKPSKVFLEIGLGGNPAFLNAKRLEERGAQFRDVRYIGLDLDDEALAATKGLLGRHPEQTQHLESAGLHHGTVDALPLEPESVDEVYIANVFAELNNHAGGKKESLSKLINRELAERLAKQGDETYIKPEVVAKFLEQLSAAQDAMKPGAQLTVVETNTPMPVDRLRGHLEGMGFVVDRVITQRDELEWAEMEAKYHITRGAVFVDEQERYILIAHKPEVGEPRD